MSEYINNRELRKNTIKDIIRQLHEGKDVGQVKQQFEKVFQGVSASEISEAEGALIAEGLPVEEVQKLCDVHASVFKGTIEEIHQSTDLTKIPGHPLAVLKMENEAIKKMINDRIRTKLTESDKVDDLKEILPAILQLQKVDIHYKRKENLFFPYMEKYGITAPPKVMWGVDDEIRQQIKDIKNSLEKPVIQKGEILHELENVIDKVEEMIFKEENIMIPMLVENLTEEEWKRIADESNEIGFLIDEVPVWNPVKQEQKEIISTKRAEEESGIINLPTGKLKIDELIYLLNTLPFDITFVDKDDVVKYFSEGKERTFPRTKAIIGRNVSNCHPPASVHIVEKIVEDFKDGAKDQEDFWIQGGDKFIFIRYYAVRNERNEYLGVLEVTQDIKPIQEITGEKRLLSM